MAQILYSFGVKSNELQLDFIELGFSYFTLTQLVSSLRSSTLSFACYIR